MNTAHHLLGIFTRFPIPGQTKTRMIPRLGAEGAADLQEAMTGHTVLRARVWAAASGARIRVHGTGSSAKRFHRWLGPELEYVEQSSGDLGARMAHAVEDGLCHGASRVVLIGCDCPEIESRHLDAAFAALADHDAVVGPAQDGGYYLIGLTQPFPELFADMAWGGGTVLDETRQRAREHNIRLAELDTLRDVDEPDELAVWEQATSAKSTDGISVIIPALNEEAHIGAAITSARPGAHEVLVADGGSTDGTRDIARNAGARVLTTPRGRATQMNAAALEATGGTLLFLHADSQLPANYAATVRRLLARDETQAGAFSLCIDAPDRKYRVLEWGVRQRSRHGSLPYGDQALFMTRDVFSRLGGYAQIPLMEDLDLVRRLKARGRVVVSDQPVLTAARRWDRLGVTRSVAINQLILLGAFCGVPVHRLARWYRG